MSVVGSPCPMIRPSELVWIKGDPVLIGEAGKDGLSRALVLEFWATWCPPCRQTIPHLTLMQRKYKDKEVRIIGISMEQDAPKVKAFVQQMGDNMDYTVAMDPRNAAQNALYAQAGANGIPHALIVDVDNNIIFSGHPMDLQFHSKLATAAAKASPRNAGGQQHQGHQQQKVEQALPPITDSYEQLMGRSVKELKGLLQERGVHCDDCLEKSDLARRIQERCSRVTFYT